MLCSTTINKGFNPCVVLPTKLFINKSAPPLPPHCPFITYSALNTLPGHSIIYSAPQTVSLLWCTQVCDWCLLSHRNRLEDKHDCANLLLHSIISLQRDADSLLFVFWKETWAAGLSRRQPDVKQRFGSVGNRQSKSIYVQIEPIKAFTIPL